ncbi:MAG: lipase family protein [Gammaproteobacteria bacterium]|nr:lipase family protein [Gammaproteobacteria bacterium]
MENEYFKAPKAMIKLPTTRAAYSDRTAWMMSEMSALAYFPFEGEKSLSQEIRMVTGPLKLFYKMRKKTDVADKISELEQRLKEYIDSRTEPDNGQSNSGKEALEAALISAGFALVRTFNKGDTQAFLAKREKDNVAVLSFRGTEENSWKDIKTDLNFRFYKGEKGAKVHSGFSGALHHVKDEIREALMLRDLESYSLYITGHSLGGALAIIASKEFEKDSLAACYTFGSPRVGDAEFGEQIKAPVYRVVNAADAVPRLPLSWCVDIIAWIISIFHGKFADYIKENFSGYIHYGDMRYLTACDNDIQKLKVLQNLGVGSRLKRFLRIVLRHGPSVAGKDHRMNEYRKKLKYYAEKRNKLDA